MSAQQEVMFTLKCPVCRRKDTRPESVCRGDSLGGPTCNHCYGIPMMLDKISIKRKPKATRSLPGELQ